MSEHGFMVVADPHLGPRKTFPISEARIVKMFQHAFSELSICVGPSDFVIAGDLFDSNIVSPSYIQALSATLLNPNIMRWGKDSRAVVIQGNHDVRRAGELGESVSALDYINGLSQRKLLCVRHSPIVLGLGGIPVLCVPFAPGSSAKEQLDLVQFAAKDADVLVGHFGVFDDSTKAPPWAERDPLYVGASVLFGYMKKHRIQAAVLGHDHSYFQIRKPGMAIVNVGAMVPRARSEQGLSYGNVAKVSYLKDRKVYVEVDVGRIPGIRYFDTLTGRDADNANTHDLLAAKKIDPSVDSGARDVVELSGVDLGVSSIEHDGSSVWTSPTTPHEAVSAYVEANKVSVRGVVPESLYRLSAGGSISPSLCVRPKRWTDRF